VLPDIRIPGLLGYSFTVVISQRIS
jgi:hypothetical protein